MSLGPHVGDSGTPIQMTATDENNAIIDISSASQLFIVFQRPDGSFFQKTASLVNTGADGLFQYILQAGDFNQSGGWKIQGVVFLPGGIEWHSDEIKIKVYPNISPTL